MHYNFMRPITADGRDVLARARVVHADDESLVITTEVIDADGNRCGFGTADAAILDRRSEIGEADPERILTTVLFTDIVSSTERTASAGDARWKQILDGHLAVVRRQLQVFRGREVNTTGDGIIATFDSPARAVQCARAITDGARHAHLEIRAGVHLGECELYGADLTGIAVVIARRVCDTGSAGEILVTSTVREASAGSGLRFTDRGMHQLKGVPDEWRLFAVES
jgi:class 3 adenylate cyclase